MKNKIFLSVVLGVLFFGTLRPITVLAQGSGNLPNGHCDLETVTWLDASGNSLGTGNITGQLNANFAIKVSFQTDEADCYGKGFAIVKIQTPTVPAQPLLCSPSPEITATNTFIVCGFQATEAGAYKAFVEFHGASVDTLAVQQHLTIGGSGGPTPTPTPPSGGPTPTPTPVGGGGGAVVVGSISNPISYDSLGALIVAVIKFLLTMLGALAVLFIIIGAVRMVTSQGNEKNVTAGKQTLTWAVIGLVVALLAFSIIGLVQSVLGRR